MSHILLQHVLNLLVLSDHRLLISFESAHLISHLKDVRIEVLDLSLELQIALPFIHQVVLHVLIDSINVVLSV